MSKTEWIWLAAATPVAGLLWSGAASMDGGVASVVSYGVASTIAGVILVWIAHAFASLNFRMHSVILSAVLGFLFATPLIAMLLRDNPDTTRASVVVLACVAAAAAAMLGAVWGVTASANEAYMEWHLERKHRMPKLRLGRA